MRQVDFSKFTPQEQLEYEASKMAYRDIKYIPTAFKGNLPLKASSIRYDLSTR